MKASPKAFRFTLLFILVCTLSQACNRPTGSQGVSGPASQASKIHVPDPEGFVRDARKAIADYRRYMLSHAPGLPVVREDFPPSLLLPGLKSGQLTRDHFDCVLEKDADWTSGVRVWIADSSARSTDQRTAYPGIFFFREPTVDSDRAPAPQR